MDRKQVQCRLKIAAEVRITSVNEIILYKFNSFLQLQLMIQGILESSSKEWLTSTRHGLSREEE